MIYLGNGMYSDAGYLQHHGVKGHAKEMTKRLIDWFNSPSNKRLDSLEWYAYKDNPGSWKAALANGFEKYYEGYDKSDHGKAEWVYLRYPPKS